MLPSTVLYTHTKYLHAAKAANSSASIEHRIVILNYYSKYYLISFLVILKWELNNRCSTKHFIFTLHSKYNADERRLLVV